MLHFRTILILSLLCASCAFRIEDEEATRRTAVNEVVQAIEKEAASVKIREEDLDISFHETDQIFQYELKIAWVETFPKVTIQIGNNDQVVLYRKQAYSTLVAHDVPIEINIIFFNSVGGQISSLKFTKKSPTDVVYSESKRLYDKDLIRGNRLFLSPQTPIITNGYDLEIDVEKIIIADGENQYGDNDINAVHILTTAPGTKSPTMGEDPRHSKISIRAKTVQGHLRVGLIGFDGNDGKSPLDRPEKNTTAGKSGEEGLSVEEFRFCVNDTARLSCQPKLICKRQPQRGGIGPAGRPGLTGGAGQNGGLTGSLVVSVMETDDMKMSVLTSAGRAGKGAEGGPGGLGGPGGQAAKFVQGCNKGLAGDEGPQGPRGKSGSDGMDGKVGLIFTPNIPLKSFQL